MRKPTKSHMAVVAASFVLASAVVALGCSGANGATSDAGDSPLGAETGGASDAGSKDATSDAGSDSPPGAETGGATDAGPKDATVDGPEASSIEAGNDAGTGDAEAGTTAPDGGTEASTPDGGSGIVLGPADGGGPTLCGSQLRPPPDAGSGLLLPGLGVQGGGIGQVMGLWMDGDAVAANSAGNVVTGGVTPRGWVLWNAPSGRVVASDDDGTIIGLAGGVLAVSSCPLAFCSGGSAQVYVLSPTDASMIGAFPLGAHTQMGLAPDGSYVWGASSTSLSAWSPSGTPLLTHAGDYSSARIFAAPGHLLVASGPAGANVIEDVVTSGGASTTSPAFTGTFASWFSDGTHFLSSVGNTVFVYTAAASQVEAVPVSKVWELGGGGNYFWDDTGYVLALYQLGGSAQPIQQINAYGQWVATPRYLAMVDNAAGATIVDLQAATVTSQVITGPQGSGAFASDSNGDWAIGGFGLIAYHGTASSPGATGTLGCGVVLGITGSPSGVVALGTSGGQTIVLDVAAASLLAEPPLASGDWSSFGGVVLPSVNNGLKLTSDGQTLAATTSDAINEVPTSDVTLFVYSAPGWGTEYSYPYPYGTQGTSLFFDMSADGSTLARTVGSGISASSFQTTVTNLSGTTTVLTYSGETAAPLLSPSGAHIAVNDSTSTTVRLYAGGTLVTAVPGTAIGWLDDNHVFLQVIDPEAASYVTRIYDAQGTLAGYPELPQMVGFDVVGPTTIYSHTDQRIYDVTTGTVVQSTGLPPQSVVAGPFIVSVTTTSLQVTRY
jgi:hypothetical protein